MGTAKEESRKIYDVYRDAGGNFLDTANVYTNGTSEKFLGEFLKGHREQMVIATKYTNAAPGVDANAAGNHRKSLMQSLEGSLQRLGTDFIDLYWVHIWDGLTPAEEVMRALDDAVRQGKILYAGISDAPAWWVAQANTLAAFRGWTPFVGLQIEYSLLERTVEQELVPMAEALGLTITAWSPLKGGMLSGKYQARGSGAESDARFTNDAMKQFRGEQDRQERVVEAVRRVSEQTGRSMAQVALAWLRTREVPVIPIIGARRMAQLEDNLASLTLALSPEQIQALDAASAVELGFPQNMYRIEMANHLRYGGMRDRIVT